MSLPSMPKTGNRLKGDMPFSGQQPSLFDIWRMVRRRKWLLIPPCITIVLGAVVLCYALPNIYHATTVILVEAQRVPESYVKSIVSTSVKDRLRTITQQVKSYTRLEEVIRSLNLMNDVRDRKEIDRYIQRMRNKIDVDVRGHEAFTISYSDSVPRTVMLVTNKLASLFIEENIKVREQYVAGTTEFLESELTRVRNLLEIQEKKVNDFRQQYTGELPDQQNANLRTLDRLQLQLQANREAIQEAQNRKSLLMQQLRWAQKNRGQIPAPVDNLPAEAKILQQQLLEHQNRLNKLKSMFTDDYPDVKLLRKEIIELQTALLPYQTMIPQSETTDQMDPNRAIWPYQQEVQQVDLDLKRLYQEKDRTQKQIIDYERKMANSYKRELELRVLTRDYESTKQSYESLLERQMQARVAENLEKRQKAEQFMVLDPARLPTEPWKPNRPRILMMGLGLGLVVGGGLVFLAETLNRSFHSTAELKQFSNLPVLSAIPLMITVTDVKRQRLRRLLVVAALVIVPLGMLTMVHVFWIDIDQLVVKLWLQLKS